MPCCGFLEKGPKREQSPTVLALWELLKRFPQGPVLIHAVQVRPASVPATGDRPPCSNEGILVAPPERSNNLEQLPRLNHFDFGIALRIHEAEPTL